MKKQYRILIKDEFSNVVPNAQIHIIKNSYLPTEKHNVFLVDTENHIKESLFFFKDNTPAYNPIICNSEGHTAILEGGLK